MIRSLLRATSVGYLRRTISSICCSPTHVIDVFNSNSFHRPDLFDLETHEWQPVSTRVGCIV
jgi:hypothetical protein